MNSVSSQRSLSVQSAASDQAAPLMRWIRIPLIPAMSFVILLGGLAAGVGFAEEQDVSGKDTPALRVPVRVPSLSDLSGVGPGVAEPKRIGRAEAVPGLDDLLHIPSGYLQPSGRIVSGAGEVEWRRRFQKAQKELRTALSTLESTKRELDEVAEGGSSSQWSVAPPGVSNSGNGSSVSPLSFRLRQELLRNRERLDVAETELKELRIEADLAGVPVDWRGDTNIAIPRRIPDSPYYN